jgi:hypothetical protein
MPVYICQAGSSSSEPWRHGLQVYSEPFALNDVPVGSSNSARGSGGEGEEDDDDNNNGNVTIAPPLVPSTRQEIDNNNNNNNHQQQRQREHHEEEEIRDGAATTDAATSGGPAAHNSTSKNQGDDDDLLASIHSAKYGLPVRRIRHAEVVLVDDVCIAFDRHWLRLRWPGTKGGFAGYVALGKVDDKPLSLLNNRVQTSSGDILLRGMCMLCFH